MSYFFVSSFGNFVSSIFVQFGLFFVSIFELVSLFWICIEERISRVNIFYKNILIRYGGLYIILILFFTFCIEENIRDFSK